MKTQLPEKIPAPTITTTFDGTNHSTYPGYLTPEAKAVNHLIDYLKEREERPTYAQGFEQGKFNAQMDKLNESTPTPPEPEWKVGDTYFFIADIGEFDASDWKNHSTDHARRDFLGVYRTREEAEAMLVKVKAVVRK